MLAGKPMLAWSVAALEQVPGVERIVVALPSEALGDAPAGTVAVAGGAVRSESVREALLASGEGDPVLVHDAARPLASPALFARVLERLERSGAVAAIAACPVSDTIKEVGDDGATVHRTLARARLWAVQTPQGFRRRALEEVLHRSPRHVLAQATDDAWLIEQAGGIVEVVPGEPENLKVTTPIDLRVAELLLSERAR
jgi:2-C-methyl-D-erythritol 4-phosphate cytidylyltransferase